MVDDAFIFYKSYKYNKVEIELINVQIKELVYAKFVEFFNEKYASIIVMPFKKDIFGNWIEKWM